MHRQFVWQYLLLIVTLSLVASEKSVSKSGSQGQKELYVEMVETGKGSEQRSSPRPYLSVVQNQKLNKASSLEAFSTPTGPAAATGSFSTPTGPSAATGSFGSASFSTPTGPAAATGSFGSFSTPTGPAAATGSFGETSVPSSFKTITSAPTTDTCYRIGESCTKNKECCTGACKSDNSDDDDKYCAADTSNTPTDEDAATGSFSTPTGPAKATGSFSTPTGPAKATGSFGETSVPSSFKSVTAAPTIDTCYRIGETCTKNKECCTGMCAKSDDSDDDDKYCAADTDNTPTDEDAPTGPAKATGSFSTPTGPAKATGSFDETKAAAPTGSFSTPTGPPKATGSFGETKAAVPTGVPSVTGPPGITPCEKGTPGFFSDDFCTEAITNTLWTSYGGEWEMSGCKYRSLGSEGSDVSWIGVKDPRSILWTEYKIHARLFLNDSCTGDAGVVFRANSIEEDEELFYYFGIGEDAVLGKANGAEFDMLDSQNLYPAAMGEWVTIKIDLKGPLFKIKVKFEKTGTEYDLTGSDAELYSGSIGLRTYNCPAVFDYIDVVGPEEHDFDGVEPCVDTISSANKVASANVVSSASDKNLRNSLHEAPSAMSRFANDIVEANVIEAGSNHEFKSNPYMLGSLAVALLASVYIVVNVINDSSRRSGYAPVPV